MKYLIYLLQGIILTFSAMCAFGGGCLIWLPIAYIFKLTPFATEIGFYVCGLVGVPFGHWFSGYLSDKWL